MLTPVADKLSDKLGTEASSTEEMIRGMVDTKKSIQEGESADASSRLENPARRLEISMISQDVKALYPSLDWKEIVRIVGEILEETEVDFSDVDYKALGKYLAVHLSPEEIERNNLISVIPRKVIPRKVGMAFLDKDLDKDGNEKWDWKGKRKVPTNLQKKKMVARTLEVAIYTLLSNHLYQFDGRVFQQQAGGPIGLEVTGILARIVMLWWDRKFLGKLKKLGINLLLYLRYVDDSNMAAESVAPGTRFVNDKVSILEEAKQEDADVPADERTARFLKTVANTILPMIQMEHDCPSNHPSGRLPILDLGVWIENGRIYHQFFKKPMASRKLVQAGSAFSTAKKRSILLEEGMRRVRNCSPELSWSEKIPFLNRFSSDMRFSGHTTSFRSTILSRVLLRYEKELSNHLEGKTKLYRTRQERLDMNREKQASSLRDTWFRKGGFTSTLTVPATPNGELAEVVRKNLEQGRQPPGTRIKVLEDGGISAKQSIVKSNQFPKQNCDREDCLLCYHQDGNNPRMTCAVSSIGYEGACTRCPSKYAYIGETSRTGYTRVREHMADYRAATAAKLPAQPQDRGGVGTARKDVKSWMWEHSRDNHDGAVGPGGGRDDYKWKITSKFGRCLQRQVDEDIRMQVFEKGGGTILNSRLEYYTAKSVQPVFRQQ